MKRKAITINLYGLNEYLVATTIAEIDWQKVEDLTSKIIADDDYEVMPDNIQRIIELFDSPDLNDPNEIDRQEAIVSFSKFLSTS